MPAIAIHAGRVFTPHEEILDSVILIEDGRIRAVGHRDQISLPAEVREVAAGSYIVAPGFVDVHIHGAGGHDVMEASAKALDRVASMVARHGTTSLVATTVSAPTEETCKSLEGIARYIESSKNRQPQRGAAAEVLGIHLEGPFISAAQRGVHPKSALVPASVKVFEQFLQAAQGHVRMLTLAPEIAGALELIEYAAKKNIVVGMGHTDATYDQTRAGIARGARHAVHVFNAMRPLHHRDPGVLGAVLTDRDVTAEIIADGIHVAAPAIEILLATKGTENILLVSDGTGATGMPDGNYRLGNFDVSVTKGVCRNSEGKLAGSTLTLDRAVRQMVSLGVSGLEAVRMATLGPARRLGIAGTKGVIAAGADADLVILTPELRVAAVMTRGAGLE